MKVKHNAVVHKGFSEMVDAREVTLSELGNRTLNEFFSDEQLVTNGDFSDGTTGWSWFDPNNINVTVDNNILTFEVINISSNRLFQNIDLTQNNKYYFATRLIRENEEPLAYLTSSNLGNSVLYPDIFNEWFSLSIIRTATSSGQVNVRFFQTSQLPKVKIKYVFFLNLTPLIANKQYSPIYDTTFDLMTDAQIQEQMDSYIDLYTRQYIPIDEARQLGYRDDISLDTVVYEGLYI